MQAYQYVPLRTYDLTETCVSAAKGPYVRPRLEGEMPKTVAFGRNVQGAKRPRVWGASSRGETSTCMGRIVQVAKRPGGEPSRGRNIQEAKRPGRVRNVLGAKRRGDKRPVAARLAWLNTNPGTITHYQATVPISEVTQTCRLFVISSHVVSLRHALM